MEVTMSQHNRSFSVLFGAVSAACLALPIALTTYVDSQRAPINLPRFPSSDSGPNWVVTPISDHTAQAVRAFKTTQI